MVGEQIVCKFDLEWIHVFAILCRKGSSTETARVLLGKVVPEMDCIREIVHRGCWDGNGVFTLETDGFSRECFAADFSRWILA